MALLARLVRFLPFLAPIIGVILASPRSQELQARKELVEAQAYARGRLSPKYCFYFLLEVALALLLIILVLAVFKPELVGIPFKRDLLEILGAARGLGDAQ